MRPTYSRVVLARDGSLLRAYLSSDHKWRFRTAVDQLPAHVTAGLICLEDQRFKLHPGVDPLAVARAFMQNLSAGRTVSGASTLTMQVSRMLAPAPRNWWNKLRESWRALRIEARLSKQEILALYLTYAPFGGNLEGLEGAAQRFFGRPAAKLSVAETAFLFLLPQSPRRWSERESVNLTNLRNLRLKKFRDCGVIGEEELRRALAEKIPEWKGNFEIHAPHVADMALARSTADRVVTTIDIQMQKSVEALFAEQERELRAAGILNGGLLAADNSNGEILAAVGNFDFRRQGDAQQFNSLLVPRSTGSLLKTFLFARLLESGDLLPESLLEDVPTEIAGYRPENYNKEYTGLVEARMALAHSLNIPWIRALRDYGVDAFMSYLLSAGLKTPQRPADVGVSMVVGGLQADLHDMVMLYRSIAEDGQMRPLSLIAGESAKHKAWGWMNPGAAHLVREALKIRGRPDFGIDPRHLNHPALRWKTGTSQGNKDAWALGFDPAFTVGVWLGNLDQTAVPALVGPEVAAPLMFDAFARLRKQAPQMEREWHPRGTEIVDVCAFSGLPASPSCPHTKQVLGIKGLALRARCTYHQDILVDEKSGFRITRECEKPGMNAKVRSAIDLGPDVADWARKNLPSLELAPRFHPDCADRPVAEGGLRILSPQPLSYVIHKDEGGRFLNIPLRLKTVQASASWRCFLNGREMNGIKTSEPLLKVPPGEHSLLCADEQGRSDQVDFSVEL